MSEPPATPLRKWLRDNATLVVVVVVCAVSALFYWSFIRPDPHVHDGYVRAQVIDTFESTGDVGLKVEAKLRLPDGSIHNVSTTSWSKTSQITDYLCLERRRHQSGSVTYVKAAPEKCPEG